MNKQIILDSKECFNHWLKGGQLLYTYPTIVGWQTCKSDHPWVNSLNTYVINDKYVELRKALAEGKTVEQIVDKKQSYETGDTYWGELEDFDSPIHEYRIKPDKPKFKVGDWVVDTHDKTIHRITNYELMDVMITNHSDYYHRDCFDSLFELWKPQPGEWVIITNIICKDSAVLIKYIDSTITSGNDFLVPFIGTLPPQLQGQ